MTGRDDDRTVGNAVEHHLQEELELIDDEHAGEGKFGIPPEHDVVEQVDAVHDDVLERDGDEQFAVAMPEIAACGFGGNVGKGSSHKIHRSL